MATLRLVGALSLAWASLARGESVVKLTAANFDELIQGDLMLVKFYAPWCGHCKAMAPAYEEAARQLSTLAQPIVLGDVDATKDPDIAQSQHIQGYPTLKIFRRGVASDYAGPRDADGIVKHMKEQAGSGAAVAAAAPATLGEGQESPLFMAKLCRDQTCNDPAFPMIDYDEHENKCVCAAHPCWDDNGKSHSCDGGEFPHLAFSYSKEGVLACSCGKEPHYMSKYIAKVKCAGEHCESPEHPLVDWSGETNRCVCRKHPCHDLAGAKHACSDDKFPILHYREEKKPEGGIKQICECKQAIQKPKAEL